MKIEFPGRNEHSIRSNTGIYIKGELNTRYKALKENGKLSVPDKFSAVEMWKVLRVLAKTVVPQFEGKLASATSVILGLNDLPDYIEIDQGTVSAADVIAAFKMCCKYSRSFILKGAQTSENYRRWGNLTPLVLYAYKEHQGINYMDWDPNDDALDTLLGVGFVSKYDFSIRKFRLSDQLPYYEFYENTDVLKEARDWFYTVNRFGKKTTRISNYPNKNFKAEEVFGRNDIGIMDKYPKNVMNMMLQGHLANALYRVPEAMILDPFDWDNTPVAYDKVEDNFEKYHLPHEGMFV